MAAADATAADAVERAGAPVLVEARPQALLIAAVRLASAAAGLVASVAAGVEGGSAAALAAFGAAIVLLAIYGGDRRKRGALRLGELQPVSAGARVEGRGRALIRAAYPSTIGLTILIAVALWPQPALAALLAGVLAGLGLMSLAGAARLGALERAREARVLVDSKSHRAFEVPR